MPDFVAQTRRQRPLLAYAAGVAVFVLNDLAFLLLDGTYQLYLADYGFRAVLLALMLPILRDVLPGPPRRGSPLVMMALFVGLVGFSMACEPISVLLGSGWRLFNWPTIENGVLWLLDMTLGLALVSVSEEFVARRLALAVLPGAIWKRVVMSSLLFGLGHWGMGYGHIVETTTIGLAFGAAYAWSGSLRLVMIAHFAVDFLVFGLDMSNL
ncbi:MAG: CPBP family intramembrane metalloprotease [Alphaproteobacteria bacterium]|nr:CPBP family intramembrane metalloprotease [Alphaproteobacteria bacterium]